MFLRKKVNFSLNSYAFYFAFISVFHFFKFSFFLFNLFFHIHLDFVFLNFLLHSVFSQICSKFYLIFSIHLIFNSTFYLF